jgi:hypothetical protein
MNYMEKTNVNVTVLKHEKEKNDKKWIIQITNTTGKIAFFIRPQLLSPSEEILPSFWSESYFSLAPGESTTVSVTCPSASLENEDPVLRISGWNVLVTELGLNKN